MRTAQASPAAAFPSAPLIELRRSGSPWALAIGTVAPNRCRLHERGGIRIMVLLGEADLPWL